MAPSSLLAEHTLRNSRSAGGPGFGKIDDVGSLRPKGQPTRPQVHNFRQLAAAANKPQKFSPRDMRIAGSAQTLVNGNDNRNATLPVIGFMTGDFGKGGNSSAHDRLSQSASTMHDLNEISAPLSRGSSAGSSSNSSRTTRSNSSREGRPNSSESACRSSAADERDYLELESENSRLRREIGGLKESILSQNRRYSKILGSQFKVPQSHEHDETSPIRISSVVSKCALCSALHNKVKRLQKELHDERESANDAVERREQLESMMHAKADEREHDQTELADAQREADDAKEKLEDEQKKRMKLESEMGSLRSALSELKTKCTTLNVRMEEVGREKSKAVGEVESLKEELKREKAKQQQQQQQAQTASKGAQESLQLREAVSALEKKKKETDVLERQTEKLQSSFDAMSSSNDDLKRQLQEAKGTVDRQAKELADLHSRLNAALQSSSENSSNEQTKDKAIAKLQDDHREQATQISRLKEQLGELDLLSKACKEHKDGLERAKKQAASDTEELAKLRNKNSELNSELGGAQKQEQELKAKIIKGLDERRQTEKMLGQEKSKHKELAAMLKKAEEEVAALRQRELDTKANMMKDLLGTVRIAVMTPCIKLSVNGRLIFASSQGILPDSKVKEVLEKEVLAKFVKVFPLQDGMEINGGNMSQIIPEFDSCMESLKNEVYSRINQMVDTPAKK